ncbi:MAG: ribbon-helix-helix domain-containing protein [Alphaproteobacteria bacterium]|nr:ribbon-helix-helix domain-containing protein [Alphaproteobacteria bacterium]
MPKDYQSLERESAATSQNNEPKSSLVSRNITVLGKRTSVRLEPDMWRELRNVSKRESCTIHDLCSLIALRKSERTSLTAAIRVFLMLYFRAAATENGHAKAGHGDFENMKRRAGMTSDWSARKHYKETINPDEIAMRLAPHILQEENRGQVHSSSV